MIVISSSLVLSESDVTPDHPIVGYRNRVTTGNIGADEEASDYPISNLANPATNWPQIWRGESIDAQEIEHTTGSADPYDFCGIAGHNFGAAEIAVSIEGDQGSGYSELVAPVIPGDDSPLLFRWTSGSFQKLKIVLDEGSVVPEAAVVFFGKLLVLPRKIWQDHTPITMGRRQKVVNGMSEAGGYLGSILTGSWFEGRIKTSLLDPDEYREDIDAFVRAAVFERQTFFFGWRPQSYSTEVGYCWPTGDVQPKNASGHGLMEFDMPIAGVV